jgi:hypothetical protein
MGLLSELKTGASGMRDLLLPLVDYIVVFPKEGQVKRNASVLRYPSMSKNKLFLFSAVQNIANLFDLEPCPANLIWPSFGQVFHLAIWNTTVVIITSSSEAGAFIRAI